MLKGIFLGRCSPRIEAPGWLPDFMRLSRVIGLEIVGQGVLRIFSSSSACDDGRFDDKSMAFKESILCVSVVLGNVRAGRAPRSRGVR